MAADLVPPGRATGVGRVQVPREQHVRFAGDKRLHRIARAPREFLVLIGLGKVERVVRDHDPRDLRRDMAEPLAKMRDLAPRHASPLESTRMRRVDPHDGDLVVGVERLEVAADVAAVVGQRKHETGENIVKRHVVVAGDDDQRARESLEELARLPKLAAAGALRQVARNRDDVGTDLPGGLEKRIESRRIDPAEVQIGEMEYRFQKAQFLMPERPTLHVILNEESGATGKEADSKRLAEIFARSGANARILRAVGGGDAVARLTRQALAESGDTIVAGGGDGTVRTVASVLVDSHRSLGVLPMGTFNYFARSLGIPLDLEAAARTVLEGNIVRINVGEVNGRFFLNNSSLGLYPDILKDREQVYARFGRSRLAAYASAAFAISRPSRFLTLRLVADGREIFRRTPLLFVANNAYQIEAFRLRGAPCLENGAFALYITHPLGPRRMLLLAIRTLLGRLRTTEDLDVLCTREVSIETRRRRVRIATDGELTVMESPLHYCVRSGALAVIAPAKAGIEKGRVPIRQVAP